MKHRPVVEFKSDTILIEHTPDLRQALVALEETIRAADIDLAEIVKDDKKRWKYITSWFDKERKRISREWYE